MLSPETAAGRLQLLAAALLASAVERTRGMLAKAERSQRFMLNPPEREQCE
jgi:hypothetical protein